MIIEATIDEKSIDGLVKDVLVKRLSNEMYNKNFQSFVNSKSPEITIKINSQIKSEVNLIVENKISKWRNAEGENIEQYVDRRIQETIEKIDFEKIIKDKYIK